MSPAFTNIDLKKLGRVKHCVTSYKSKNKQVQSTSPWPCTLISTGSLAKSTPLKSIPSKTVNQSSRTGNPSSGMVCLKGVGEKRQAHNHIAQVATGAQKSCDRQFYHVTFHRAIQDLTVPVSMVQYPCFSVNLSVSMVYPWFSVNLSDSECLSHKLK